MRRGSLWTRVTKAPATPSRRGPQRFGPKCVATTDEGGTAEAPRGRRASQRRSELPTGRPARAEHASCGSRYLGALGPPERPDRAARGAGRTRVPELVPIRHGRMLVSPFTYYRGAALPWRPTWPQRPTSGIDGPALRRRASLQLRHLRLARAPPVLRRERLRRDGAGTVGMGREAAGRELRDRRARERLHHKSERGSCAGDPVVPRDDARVSRLSMLEVWYAHLDMDELLPRFQALSTRSGRRACGARSPRPGARQPPGLRQAVTIVDGEPRIVTIRR